MIANKLQTVFNSAEDIRDTINELDSTKGNGTIDTLDDDLSFIHTAGTIVVTDEETYGVDTTASPIYTLSSHTCSGNASTAVNTGLTLYDGTYTNGFTIIAEIYNISSVMTDTTSNQRTFLTCMSEAGSPWPGFTFRKKTGNNNWEIQVNGSNINSQVTSTTSSFKFIYQYTGSSSKLIINGTEYEGTGAVPEHSYPLLIGGSYGSTIGSWTSNRFGNFMIDLKVYNEVVNEILIDRELKVINYRDSNTLENTTASWQQYKDSATAIFMGPSTQVTYNAFSPKNVPWSKIKEIYFSENQGTTIYTGTCRFCTTLEKVWLSSTVTEIQNYAFQSCSNLTDINLSNIQSIGNAAFAYSGITEVNVPNLTSLGTGTGTSSVFSHANVAKVTNLGSITKTPGDLFSDCTHLSFVRYPATITSIGAIWRCGTYDMICLATTPPTVSWNKVATTIYVPDESVKDYKIATGWSNYASRIKPLSEYTGTD